MQLALLSLALAGAAAAGPLRPGQMVVVPRQTQQGEAERAAAVREGFRHAWNGYYDNAFPNDELRPVSNTTSNSRNGWGASAVDALSTAIIMGEEEIVNQIIDHIQGIDFTQTSTEVSLFETTIRYLGGMLSGYDLLTGPASNLNVQNDRIQRILDQSVNLANAMRFAFDTASGVPYNNLNVPDQTPVAGQDTNGLATTGTLILEWQRLSDLTGDPVYGELVARAEEYLLRPQPPSSEPFPGLVGSSISIESGQFTDSRGGWNGGTDSFYEYLIKMFVYDPSAFDLYRERWIAAADSSIEFLASHPEPRPDLTYLAEYDGQDLDFSSGHLACFDGGNFVLGGLVLGEQRYVDFGLELAEACHNTYTSTVTRVGPDGFAWNSDAVPGDQADFFQENGFYITSGRYLLRPEVIESYYYAYRATGDSKYQDWAWDAFVAINATCRTALGYSGVTNVNAERGGDFDDFQESFLFAEVMKYSYLIHAPDAPYQVARDNSNQFVYNTEAHPVLVRAAGGYPSNGN